VVGKIYEKSSLALYLDMNFSWGKISCMECCTGKERSGIAWLLAGAWKLREIRKKIGGR
jgi:hypothetical protein